MVCNRIGTVLVETWIWSCCSVIPRFLFAIICYFHPALKHLRLLPENLCTYPSFEWGLGQAFLQCLCFRDQRRIGGYRLSLAPVHSGRLIPSVRVRFPAISAFAFFCFVRIPSSPGLLGRVPCGRVSIGLLVARRGAWRKRSSPSDLSTSTGIRIVKLWNPRDMVCSCLTLAHHAPIFQLAFWVINLDDKVSSHFWFPIFADLYCTAKTSSAFEIPLWEPSSKIGWGWISSSGVPNAKCLWGLVWKAISWLLVLWFGK